MAIQFVHYYQNKLGKLVSIFEKLVHRLQLIDVMLCVHLCDGLDH
jgi:hypothetical protein